MDKRIILLACLLFVTVAEAGCARVSSDSANRFAEPPNGAGFVENREIRLVKGWRNAVDVAIFGNEAVQIARLHIADEASHW